MTLFMFLGVGFTGIGLALGLEVTMAFAFVQQLRAGMAIPVLVRWSLQRMPECIWGRGIGWRCSAFFLGQFVSPRGMRLLGGSCLLVCALAIAPLPLSAAGVPAPQPTLGTREAPVLEVNGLRFRDLNRNGRLDPYEDWRLPPEQRVRDLLARMTLGEKAGTLMHGTVATQEGPPNFGTGRTLDQDTMRERILGRGISSFISRMSLRAGELAAVSNTLQAVGEQGRLGIPLSLSSDPRNHFDAAVGQGVEAGSFTRFPQPLGLGAVNDPALTRRFADIVRQEYRAVGFNVALSPQADLATEPRWPRVYGTFGEDAAAVSRQVGAYVSGIQAGSKGLHADSVVAVVKHFAGYGAAKDGWDSHSPYGRFMAFPGGRFADHVRAFDGAFAARVGSVMPTYSMPEGRVVHLGLELEPVAGAFNKPLIAGLLRGRLGFRGVVLSDWGVTNDCRGTCLEGAAPGRSPFELKDGFGAPWGVEDLSPQARMVKALNAGVDQFGGVEDVAALTGAVESGQLSVEVLNAAVARVLLQKFQQGLFENPFVAADQADRVVGQPRFQAEAAAAQRRSLVLLHNRSGFLPLRSTARKIYLAGIDAEQARRSGFEVVDKPELADLAVIRMAAPYEVVHPQFLFGVLQHEGSLAWKDDHPELKKLRALAAAVPTVAFVYLERPALLQPVVDAAHAVVGHFGAGDAALLDLVAGRFAPTGRLPLELPRTPQAVEAQHSDKAGDSAWPLFKRGFCLRFAAQPQQRPKQP